jgi:hypothetical protein
MNPFGGIILAPFAEFISQLSPGGNLVEIIRRDNIGDFFCLGIKLSMECVFWKAHKISLEIRERNTILICRRGLKFLTRKTLRVLLPPWKEKLD